MSRLNYTTASGNVPPDSAVGFGQRFTEDHPCPICRGYNSLPHGQSIRCWGFLSDDGKFAHCTREEYAGDLEMTDAQTYPHFLKGPCKCGEDHRSAEERELQDALRAARKAIEEAKAKEALEPEWDEAYRRWNMPQGFVNPDFFTAEELCTMTPKEPEWVLPGYIAIGASTEFDGFLKVGKTTFLWILIKSILDGLPFLNLPTHQTPVVYLSEQNPTTISPKLRSVGLTGRKDLHILCWPLHGKKPWEAFVKLGVEKCVSTGASLLIIDTLGRFAGIEGDGENSAGKALEVMTPIQAAVANNQIAIVLSRHERKSGGEVGMSGRGSSAFSGDVDAIISLRRSSQGDRVRELHYVGRWDNTPSRLAIELDPFGDHYVVLGTPKALRSRETVNSILAVLPEDETNALSREQIMTETGLKGTQAKEILAALVDEKKISFKEVTVQGGKKFFYWAKAVERPLKADGDHLKQPETEAVAVADRGILSDRPLPNEKLSEKLEMPTSGIDVEAVGRGESLGSDRRPLSEKPLDLGESNLPLDFSDRKPDDPFDLEIGDTLEECAEILERRKDINVRGIIQ